MSVESHLELSSDIRLRRRRDHRKIPPLPLNALRNAHKGTNSEIRTRAYVRQVSAMRYEIVAHFLVTKMQLPFAS